MNVCSFLGVLLVKRKTAFPEGRMQLPGRFGWWGGLLVPSPKSSRIMLDLRSSFFLWGGVEGRVDEWGPVGCGGGGRIKLGERNKTYFWDAVHCMQCYCLIWLYCKLVVLVNEGAHYFIFKLGVVCRGGGGGCQIEKWSHCGGCIAAVSGWKHFRLGFILLSEAE